MRGIRIIESTLRQAPRELSFRERLELARVVMDMRPDCINAGEIISEAEDGVFLRAAAAEMGDIALMCEAGTDEDGIARAFAQIKTAARPVLCLCAPASPVRMEYSGHKKAPQMLAAILAAVRAARALCPEVLLKLEDATRAEREFVLDAARGAHEAGACGVIVCDDAGVLLPEESRALAGDIRQGLPEGMALYVQCADEAHMAAACALDALRGGADGAVTAAHGMGITETAQLSHILFLRGDACGLRCNLDVTRLARAAGRAEELLARRRGAFTPFDGLSLREQGAQDAVLDATSDITRVAEAITARGYALSPEDVAQVYAAFCRVRDKKPVGARELDALIASAARQAPPAYRLKSYHVNASNIISPTAHIVLEKDEHELQGLSVGDGPIDAAFLAIEQIAGRHFELDDFQIQAVTEGRGAMGDALVKLRHNGRLYSGKGLSTDILGASIRAYLSALNKIAYEESKA